MAGTSAGGKKAALANKARHGNDFYANIGRKGGVKGHTGGFYNNSKRARLAGAKGGTISSKAKLTPKEEAERRELAQKRYEMRLKDLEGEDD